MKKVSSGRCRGDFFIAAGLIVVLWFLAIYFDLFEYIHDVLHRFEHWQVDELLLVILSVSVASSWLAFRRWNDAVYESRQLQQFRTEFDTAQRVANIGSWRWNMVDNSEQWSDQFYLMLGLDAETTIASYDLFLKLVHSDDKPMVLEAVDEAIRTGSYRCDFRMLRADHSIIFVHSQAKVIFDAAGEAIEMGGTILDVSRLKQSESVSRESELRLQSILDNTTAVIYLKDLEGRYILINREYERFLGVTLDEVKGNTDHDIFPKEMADAFRENDLRVISENRCVEMEEQAPHHDGMHTFLSVKFPLCDDQGEPYGVAGISTDITERKRAEVELQKTQERYEEAQHVAHLGHWELDLIENRLIWSKENCQIFGGATGAANNYETFLERVHPDDRDSVNQAFTGSLEKKTPYDTEHRLLMPDGSVKWVQEQCHTDYNEDGKPVRSIGTTQEITKRKLAEIEMTRSRARFSGIVEMAADAIVSINEEQEIILFNRAAEQMFGCSQAEVLGESVEQFIPERFQAGHRRGVESILSGGNRQLIHKKGALFGLRRNGEEFPIEVSMSKQVVEGDTIMTVMIRDLTGQMEAEAVQRKLLKAISEAGEAIIITDDKAVIEYVNPAFTEITGYESDEAIGNTPAMLKSDAQDPKFYTEMWQTITSGNVWHGTLIDRKNDGSFYPALMSVAPIHDENGAITHYVSLQQDMTEYKKMEGQFLQAQKMEAVGTLVGGIAHDFNNMLAAIQGNIYLARMKIEQGEYAAADEKVGHIEKITFSAADMVKQLLTFARKDSVSMVELPLKSYLKEALKLAGSAVPESIELEFNITEEDPHICGDSTQVQQMVMNLLNNARDAVSAVAEPRITVELSRVDPDEDFLLRHPEQSGFAMALLSIADNGCGIAEKNLQKIFEPFFTTKGVGDGTGLGLAMVFGAVQRHGGAIEVESSKGTGTVFNIYLPLVNKRAEVNKYGQSSDVAFGMNETVLLVDDEAVLRTTTSELLSSIGYQVLEAADGYEALQVYAAHQQDIALMITDIVMPKMGGIKLSEEIRRIREDLPIILVTGYDKDRGGAASQEMQYSIVLDKPFNIKNLSHIIRDLLTD